VQPSYASGSWLPLHFGVGMESRVDLIEIIPPGEKTPRWTLHDVAAGRLYRLVSGKLLEVRKFRTSPPEKAGKD